MSQPSSSPTLFGLGFGAIYALVAFTLTITGCLPLALIATMQSEGSGAERANALMAWLPVMAGFIAVACTVFFFTTLRHKLAWQRPALLAMWALSALGMAGWWTL